MKIRLGILDADIRYVKRLVSFMNINYADKMEIYAFSELEALEEHLQKKRLDIVVASPDSIPEDYTFAETTALIFFSDSTEIDTIRGIRTICKYQKAELIFYEILNIYAEIDTTSTYRSKGKYSPLITFIGASGGVGTTTAAMACALNLTSLGKNVLYLNCEENGFVDHYLTSGGNDTLSEVLYAVKSRNSNLPLKLESMLGRDESGISFFKPFRVPLDYADMKAEDLEQIIDIVNEIGSYNYIIADAESVISPKRDVLLKRSEMIIVVGDGTEVSNAKLTRLLQSLTLADERDGTNIFGHIQILYNKFGSQSTPARTGSDEAIFGQFNKYANAGGKQIVQLMAQRNLFEKLLNE